MKLLFPLFLITLLGCNKAQTEKQSCKGSNKQIHISTIDEQIRLHFDSCYFEKNTQDSIRKKVIFQEAYQYFKSNNLSKSVDIECIADFTNSEYHIFYGYSSFVSGIGELYLDSLNYDSALVYFRQNISDYPDSYFTYFELANAFFRSNQIDSSIYYYNTSLEKDSSQGESLYGLGCIYMKNNDTISAFNVFKKANKIGLRTYLVGKKNLLNKLAETSILTKNYAEAENSYHQLLREKIDVKNTHNNLSKLYSLMGNDSLSYIHRERANK